MSAVTPTVEKLKPSKWLLLGLLSAVFAVNVIDVFAPLLYPEIAATFHITVGTAVQLSAFSAAAGVITGLLLSAFSIRFRYKTLLTAGVLCVVLCVLGVFLAPTFLFAQVFYALNGVGSVMVAVMSPTIIAELYPLNKKATRISWSVATAQLALIIGNPVTGFIASNGNVASWRDSLLWFMLPVTSISLLFVLFLIPSKPMFLQDKKNSILHGYRNIFSNRSAVACLTNAFFAGAFFGLATFQSAFLSTIFHFPPSLRGIVAVVGGSLLVTGMLSCGLLVNRIGRKSLLIGGAVPAILLSVSSYAVSLFVTDVWIVLGLRFASAFLGGFALVAGPNLSSRASAFVQRYNDVSIKRLKWHRWRGGDSCWRCFT